MPTLSLSDDWEVLSLPAIAQIDEDIPISATKVHRRRIGEALSPEREPLEVLTELKLQLGSDAFSAQYQQAPAPPGGAMIKRAWVRRYEELPFEIDRLMVIQSWDTASKGGPENDFSVCTTWIMTLLFAADERGHATGENPPYAAACAQEAVLFVASD